MRRNLEIVSSKDLKIRPTSLHDKAIRLLEGGIVECDSLCVKAIVCLDPDAPCLECHMDSACTINIMELCAEVDQVSRKGHCLSLASENN